MTEPNFWDDKRKSEAIIGELNGLKECVENLESLQEEIKIHLEMCELEDSEIEAELMKASEKIEQRLNKLEIEIYTKLF